MPNKSLLKIVCCILCSSTCQVLSAASIIPSGNNIGTLQFDAVVELIRERQLASWVVFARYWVYRDFYCIAVIWSEPRGHGIMDLKTNIVLSDKDSFKIHNDSYAFWKPINATYQKPVGPRPPFEWGGGPCEIAELRFADAHALARRVYVEDVEQVLRGPSDGSFNWRDLPIPSRAGTTEDLARARVQIAGGKIQRMELFDPNQKLLARLSYDYTGGNSLRIDRLTAELPERPVKLATHVNDVTVTDSNGTRTLRLPDTDYIRHKGGRICTVEYRDVAIGKITARLPVSIEVRSAVNGSLLRSARIVNFRLVDMDKTKALEAAKAFAGLTDEDRRLRKILDRFLPSDLPRWKVKDVKVDPNDLGFVRVLIAKYPLPETPNPPRLVEVPGQKITPPAMPIDPNHAKEYREYLQQQHQERQRQLELSRKQREQYYKEFYSRLKPPRLMIEPNDLRAIRALLVHYDRMLSPPPEKMGEPYVYDIPKELYHISDFRSALRNILAYHHQPELPEDAPAKPNQEEFQAIQQLRNRYLDLTSGNEKGLGGRLKALHAVTQLDEVLQDWRSQDTHNRQYLDLLNDYGLCRVCMESGCYAIETMVKAGQPDMAYEFMRTWASRCISNNEPNDILRFANVEVRMQSSCWPTLWLVDGLLRRPGLTPIQRYQCLAVRAIVLHKVDSLLAGLDQADNKATKAPSYWIPRNLTRQQIASQVGPAIQQAVSAWRSLGPAAFDQARPYTSSGIPAAYQYIVGVPDSTPLQELSAMLDQIVWQRSTRAGQQPGATQPGPIQPGTRQPGARQSIPRQPLQRR